MIIRQLKQKRIVEGNVFSAPVDLGALSDNVFVQLEDHPDIKTLTGYIEYMETQKGVDWEEL